MRKKSAVAKVAEYELNERGLPSLNGQVLPLMKTGMNGAIHGGASYGVVVKRTFRLAFSDEPLSSSKQLAQEYKLLKRLRHPHIIAMDLVSSTPEMVVLPFMTGKTLFDVLVEGKVEVDGLLVCKQLATALVCLDDHDIVHRDIHLRNVGVMLPVGDNEMQVILMDFGLSVEVSEAEGPVGTIEYVCPEAMGRYPQYSPKSDVWSLGALMFEVIAWFPLFIDMRVHTYEDRIKAFFRPLRSCEYHNLASACELVRKSKGELAETLLRGMVTQDPADRMSARGVLACFD